MNFVKFLENHFQELKLKEGEAEVNSFDIKLDSEIKATHTVLTAFRTTLQRLMVPKVLAHYALVLTGIARCPEPVLLNKIKEQKQSQELAKAAQEAEEIEAEGEFH